MKLPFLALLLLAACGPDPEGGVCRSWGPVAVVGTDDDTVGADDMQAIAADFAEQFDAAECSIGGNVISCLFQGGRDQAYCEAAIAAVDVDTGGLPLTLRCDSLCEF